MRKNTGSMVPKAASERKEKQLRRQDLLCCHGGKDVMTQGAFPYALHF